MSDASETAALDQILEFLRHTRGFDFDAYKRPSLTRRMRKRMDAVGIQTFEEYSITCRSIQTSFRRSSTPS